MSEIYEELKNYLISKGWVEQVSGDVGQYNTYASNFYKDDEVLSIIVSNPNSPSYPSEEEIKEMFEV